MNNPNQLIIFQESVQLIRMINNMKFGSGFGDLERQLKKAVLSVSSNIAEGAMMSSAGFRRHLVIARGSVNEAEAQLTVLAGIGTIETQHPAHELSQRIGKRISCLIKRIEEARSG